MSLLNGLIAAYLFENDVTDALGVYDGTSQDISFSAGQNNQSVQFLAPTSVVKSARFDTLAGSSQMSCSFWVNPSVVSLQWIASNYSTGADNRAFLINLSSSNEPRFLICDSNGGADAAGVSDSSVPINAWSQVTCVFDGTQTGNSNRMKIYINGLSQSLTFTGTVPAVINPNLFFENWFGNLTNNSALYLNGKLDELYFWDRALTGQEAVRLTSSYYPFASSTSNFFYLLNRQP